MIASIITAKTVQSQSIKSYKTWKTKKLVTILSRTLTLVLQNEFNKLIDIIAIVNAQNFNNCYIFHNI